MLDQISEEFLDHLRAKHSWPASSTEKPHSMSTDWQPCLECENLNHRLNIFKTQSFVMRLINSLLLLAMLGHFLDDLVSKGFFWGTLNTINVGLALLVVVLSAANVIFFSNNILRQSLRVYCAHLRDINDPIDANTGILWIVVALVFAYNGAMETKVQLSGVNLERAVTCAMKNAFWVSFFLHLAIFPLFPAVRDDVQTGEEVTGTRRRPRSSRKINVLARLSLLILVTTQCTVSIVTLALLSLKLSKIIALAGFFLGLVGYFVLMTSLLSQWAQHGDSLFDFEELIRRVVEMMEARDRARAREA